MVEAEGEIEGRVAVPGAFGVEEHRAARPDQDVFRADVAMHQRAAACAAVISASRPSGAGEIGMRAARGDQIRLDADRVETVVGGEVARDRGIAGRRGMDAGQPLADRQPRLAGSACPSRSRCFQTG